MLAITVITVDDRPSLTNLRLHGLIAGCIGLDAKPQKVTLHVTDLLPCFYARLPWATLERDLLLLSSRQIPPLLQSRIRTEITSLVAACNSLGFISVDMRLVWRRSIYGYQAHCSPFLKIQVRVPEAAHSDARYLTLPEIGRDDGRGEAWQPPPSLRRSLQFQCAGHGRSKRTHRWYSVLCAVQGPDAVK